MFVSRSGSGSTRPTDGIPMTATAEPLSAPCPVATVEPQALPATDAARLLNVSLSHFYQLHKTGRLPLPVRLGRAVRWRVAELTAWLDAGCPARDRWQLIRGDGR